MNITKHNFVVYFNEYIQMGLYDDIDKFIKFDDFMMYANKVEAYIKKLKDLNEENIKAYDELKERIIKMKCKNCNGDGHIPSHTRSYGCDVITCPTCEGTGEVDD